MHTVVKNTADGRWILTPSNTFVVYTPKERYLTSSARPFGAPPDISAFSPLTQHDVERVTKWQEDGHTHLESSLGLEVHGYATVVDSHLPPLLIRELPDVVGTKIWYGEWFLWEAARKRMKTAGSILEVGSGCGVCGLLLAANGLDGTVSDTRDGYEGAQNTWDNLTHNVAVNSALVAKRHGIIRALELDWNSDREIPRYDMALGSDIVYEPHLFRALFRTLRRAAPRAMLVQNVARRYETSMREICGPDSIFSGGWTTSRRFVRKSALDVIMSGNFSFV